MWLQLLYKKKLLKKEMMLNNKDCVSEPHTQYYIECKNNNTVFSLFWVEDKNSHLTLLKCNIVLGHSKGKRNGIQ